MQWSPKKWPQGRVAQVSIVPSGWRVPMSSWQIGQVLSGSGSGSGIEEEGGGFSKRRSLRVMVVVWVGIDVGLMWVE